MATDKNKTPILAVKNVSFNVTPEALEFLSGTTNGVSNYSLFLGLLSSMALVESTSEKRGISISLRPGQVELSMSSFEEKWGIKRKQAKGFVDHLVRLELVRRNSTKLTTIIDMVCVSGWRVNKQPVKNPLYLYSVQRPQ